MLPELPDQPCHPVVARRARGRAQRGACRHRRAPARRRWCRSRCSMRRGAATARILMLEPRRLATRAAATRMAALLGEAVGGTVGYRTRLDAAVSPATRIEVVTEGLLIRRLQSDPGLDGVAAVILDEVHERSVESDLALALCRDLQRVLRPELRLIAMSATAEVARLAGLLDAEAIESSGHMFPVEISHAARDIPGPRELPEAMARAVRAALAAHDGDILAFLPGMAEIRRTQAALEGCGALVLPLHGDLPPADAGSRAAAGRGEAGGAGDIDRRDLADRSRRAHRGGWRLAPGAAARSVDRPDAADDAAYFPCGGRAAGRAGGARGAGGRGPAVVHGAASRPGRARPAGDPRGGPVGPGSGLRRLGIGAGRSAVPRSAAAGRPGRGDRAAGRTRRARCPGAHHRRRTAHGGARRASAAGGDDAGRRDAGRGGARGRPRRAAGGARSVARPRRAGGYRPAPRGNRRRRSGGRPRGAVAHPPRRRPVPPAAAAARRCARRWRSRPAARRGVSRPHRAAARRAGQLPAGGRRRSAAAARRSARQRAAAGGRRAGTEGGGAHQAGRSARSRHAAGRSHHRAGGDQLRSGFRRGAGATPAAARGAGPRRPHGAGGAGRGRGGAGPRGRGRRVAGAALDRCRTPVPGAGRADAAARTRRWLARPVRRGADRRVCRSGWRRSLPACRGSPN